MQLLLIIIVAVLFSTKIMASNIGAIQREPVNLVQIANTGSSDLPVFSTNEYPKSISFTTFEKEFIFTNTVDDYRRSLVRLRENYQIGISRHVIRSLGEEIPIEIRSKLASLSTIVGEEAKTKSMGVASGFYAALQILNLNVKSMNEAAFVELRLVDLQRDINAKIVPFSDELDVKRFDHLVQHARYEIFSSALRKAY